MAPRKKGNKKGDDEWESELGETPDLIATATQEVKENDAAKDGDEDDTGGRGGGLLAALKKNKKNKKAKGKHVEEDSVEGEDSSGADGVDGRAETDDIADLASKAVTEEATAEDLFGKASSKGKDRKGKPTKKDELHKEDIDEDGEGGGLKSKKEKEKEKKEREKQRKKEQVCLRGASRTAKSYLSAKMLTRSC